MRYTRQGSTRCSVEEPRQFYPGGRPAKEKTASRTRRVALTGVTTRDAITKPITRKGRDLGPSSRCC